MNGFKTETMKKHYKANRTLRTGVIFLEVHKILMESSIDFPLCAC